MTILNDWRASHLARINSRCKRWSNGLFLLPKDRNVRLSKVCPCTDRRNRRTFTCARACCATDARYHLLIRVSPRAKIAIARKVHNLPSLASMTERDVCVSVCARVLRRPSPKNARTGTIEPRVYRGIECFPCVDNRTIDAAISDRRALINARFPSRIDRYRDCEIVLRSRERHAEAIIVAISVVW